MTRKAFLVALALGAGFLIDAVWARLVRGFHLQRADYPKFVVGGFRVHHSIFGYVAVLVGLFAYPQVLVPLGIGIIVGHGLRDGLYGFIERAQ